jgi:hypothetical protein
MINLTGVSHSTTIDIRKWTSDMKTLFLILINLLLYCTIAMACIAHPLESCNETSAPNSSVCSISNALESHDNDTDQGFGIHAYQTRPTPVLSTVKNNPLIIPVLVISVFTPPQLLS